MSRRHFRLLILSVLVAAFTAIGAVVFAEWLATGTGEGNAAAGTAVELRVEPADNISVDTKRLVPGGTGDLEVVLFNDNPYEVEVREIVQDGLITSDLAGCDGITGEVTYTAQTGSWTVPSNGHLPVRLADVLAMGASAVNECQGAEFSVPVAVAGGSGTSTSDGFLTVENLTSSSPDLFEMTYDFGVVLGLYDPTPLGPEALEIISDANGPTPKAFSQGVAFAVLAESEGAELLKVGTEIVYVDGVGKRTDFLVAIDSVWVGVRVVRAAGYPLSDPYTVSQASALLEGELVDVQLSTMNVAPVDLWEKQVLAVLAYAPAHATALATAWGELDAAIRSDTIVVVIVTDGDDDFIYG